MRLLFLSFVFLFFLSFINGQAPIPHRPSGVLYPGTSSSADAPILFEIFIDPLCPDCKATWPIIKQIASHYQNKIRLLTHIFPLPYHTWSFMASQGFQTIASVSGGNNTALYQYLDLIFNNQYLFDNDVTAKSSSNDLINLFSQTVEKSGLASATTFSNGLADPTNNWNARVEWKYGCSRSILGTPSFLINGVFVGASSSWQLSDWQTVLDPLLPNTQQNKSSNNNNNDDDDDVEASECPAGRALCTYLPGKTECCLAGEFCIPNVGCRC